MTERPTLEEYRLLMRDPAGAAEHRVVSADSARRRLELKVLLIEPLLEDGERVVVEHRFHAVRRWRFDIALPDRMIALEIEGGAWVGGRHVRGTGYLADMEKYNAATESGWRLLRCTWDHVRNGEALDLLRRMIGVNSTGR